MINSYKLLKFKIYNLSTLIIYMTLLLSCKKDTDISIFNLSQSKPNILLIIADDLGLDACPGYNFGTIKPTMPTLETMISKGLTFNNLWSNPTCTPSRSTIITGKYGFRTGVMKIDDELSTSETSIQKYLDNNLGPAYNHAVIGKWHLSRDTNHPINMGINYYAGSLTGGISSYWDWILTENGRANNSTEYITSKYTDLAIDWVQDQTQPWFLWLAYNAPHDPFHLPPNDLHSQGQLASDQASIEANPMPYYMAMLEAMDTEIGRLLSAMSPEEKDNTVIIFIGDNGTPAKVAQENNSQKKAKGSLYQGGINVPMIISGKNVSRINQTEDALINTSDLFATIASIAGVPTSKINDSQNFIELLSNSSTSIRDYVYSETGSNSGNSGYTIRNNTHKYIYFANESEALYNLSVDPLETENLLNSKHLPLSSADDLIKEELVAKLNEIRK